MQILNIEQGSKEWHDRRRCKVTGSKLEKVMGTSLARAQLIAELIAEEATEQTKIIRATDEMERGTAEEIFAIKMFEARTGKKVSRVGICISDEYDWLAVSPDGLVKHGDVYSEAIEVKSPDSKTAIFARLANLIPQDEIKLPKSNQSFLGIPESYKWQVVQYFIVNPDLKLLNFVVYDARFIDDQEKMYIIKVESTNEMLQDAIKEAKETLVKFRADWLAWSEIVLPKKF